MSFTTPVPDAAGGQDPQNDCLYVPAGMGVTKWVAGDVYTMKVSATTTNGWVRRSLRAPRRRSNCPRP